ncbi:Glycerophosphoryl diester phosphodiesterase [Pyrodictium delaneyi]|uniref:Glycerophosphodiester phosphodiesterase n=1 Tax=Pyrodictium delaneyi TaxID=1273541 RepID=A0A0P0N590_9CREN|nr:glycerophosphodiester phosphodiesterase [Pyrodictium delaneyi]ALL01578.1 Glycerophosphoryl diester phosphodiesterase [Pyrodictium delaneyi]OWJ55175.1 glycerophosphodiester phosphodiesterase [Pyrodictium delaneyi]
MLLHPVLEMLSRRPFAVIGHRGARGLAPENTLAALRKAVEVGADIAEFDLQVTGDGAVVASHDPVLRSNGGRTIDVRKASLAEVKSIDLGGGEAPPTLEEIIEEARGRILLFLEVKEPRDTSRIIEVLRKENALDMAALISFHDDVLHAARRLEPGLPTGIIYFRPPGRILDCRKLGCRIVLPRYPLATAKAVGLAHRLGLRVVAWTVNEEHWVLELAKRGVDGIATDYPDMVVATRRRLAEGGLGEGGLRPPAP